MAFSPRLGRTEGATRKGEKVSSTKIELCGETPAGKGGGGRRENPECWEVNPHSFVQGCRRFPHKRTTNFIPFA